MKLSGRSIIGFGQGSSNGAIFRAHNPVSAEAIAPDFYSASAEEVERAARLAHDAFATYSRTRGHDKAKLLRRIAANIEAVAEEIVER